MLEMFFRKPVVLCFLLTLPICKGFKVIWNVPSQQCIQYGFKFSPLLTQYGIEVNEDDRFHGDVVTIFYDGQLGLYPKIVNNIDINGGIPQLGNLTAHLQKTKEDIRNVLPKKKAYGLRIIDWEAWRPTWEFNWEPLKIYQNRSKDLVKKKHPAWPDAAVAKEAEQQWENSTRTWMLETLNLAKRLRPNNEWCYYLFPDCYKYNGNSPKDFQCSSEIRRGNDRLKWLWKSSTALCPSVYLYESQIRQFNFQQRTWFTNGRLREALRVNSKTVPIYPYISYSLTPDTMVPEDDFWRIMAQIASLGMDGAVVWGSSSSVRSRTHCLQLQTYIIQTLGPASEKVAYNYKRCSKQVCNGRGACTWPRDEAITSWRFLAEKTEHGFYSGDIECRCSKGYKGRFCHETVENIIRKRKRRLRM